MSETVYTVTCIDGTSYLFERDMKLLGSYPQQVVGFSNAGNQTSVKLLPSYFLESPESAVGKFMVIWDFPDDDDDDVYNTTIISKQVVAVRDE